MYEYRAGGESDGREAAAVWLHRGETLRNLGIINKIESSTAPLGGAGQGGLGRGVTPRASTTHVCHNSAPPGNKATHYLPETTSRTHGRYLEVPHNTRGHEVT